VATYAARTEPEGTDGLVVECPVEVTAAVARRCLMVRRAREYAAAEVRARRPVRAGREVAEEPAVAGVLPEVLELASEVAAATAAAAEAAAATAAAATKDAEDE
jgi:hypothetical protein